jgi:hypothetical protein
VALIPLTCVPAADAQSSNLLRNHSFEADGLESWAVTGTALRLERGDWHPRTGRWSFGIGNDGGPRDAYGRIFQDAELTGATAGRKCFLTIWLMMEANYTGTFSMKLEFLGPDGKTLREFSRPAGGSVGQGWELARVAGIVPAGAARVRASCAGEHMKSGTGQSFVWMDDASLSVE